MHGIPSLYSPIIHNSFICKHFYIVIGAQPNEGENKIVFICFIYHWHHGGCKYCIPN